MKTIYLVFAALMFPLHASSGFTPGAPTNLVGNALSPTSAAVQWDDNTVNETGFRIYRMVSGEPAFQRVGEVRANVTEFIDQNLADHSTATYFVTAFDLGGETLPSNQFSLTTPRGFYSIAGRVVDSDFRPIPGSEVILLGQDLVKTNSEHPNARIEDHSSIEIPLEFTDDLQIDDVKVGLSIAHTYKGDLKVTIVHPDGTSVVLHNHTGGSANDIRTEYPTQTAPSEALNKLFGKSSKGQWRMIVSDNYSGDRGLLEAFYITAKQNRQEVGRVAVRYDGSYRFGPVISGDYFVAPAASSCVFNPAEKALSLSTHIDRVHFVGACAKASR